MEKIFITEKQLEDFIFNTNTEKLYEKGITIDYYKIKRQLKIGNYGVADLVSIRRPSYDFYNDGSNVSKILYKGCITIFELKRDIINVNSLLQASRYLKGIKKYLKKRNFNLDFYDFRIILIGSDLETKGDFVYLLESLDEPLYLADCSEMGGMLSDISIYTYNMNIDGLSFDSENIVYSLTNEGF
jgi:hypothetical protein